MTNDIVLTILIQTVAFIGAFVKMFTDMKIKLKELDIRLSAVEKREDDIGDKLERIFSSLNDIKLSLKDKADRP
jgi:Na+-transporting methylmalonyl-CoA/oxaloacetate decarboxylase gamma subunit